MGKILKNEMCLICGKNSTWTKVTSLPGFIFGKRAEIAKCSQCGCAKTIPPPVSLELYENNNRYVELFTEKRAIYAKYSGDILSVLDGLMDPHGRKLLDVASGGGFLVEVAKARGYAAEGVELNREMVSWCKGRGLNVHLHDALDFLASCEPYDVIVLSSIIEHLEDPIKLIEACRKALKPGGMILVSQAIFNGLLPVIFPWGWYGWQPKEHHWHFTDKSLVALFQSLGFEVIQSKRFSLHHPWFFYGGIKNLVGRNVAAILARVAILIGREDGYLLVVKVKDSL